MVIFEILLGAALVTAGRRLFWLFVGAMGFILGLLLAGMLFKGQPEWVTITASLGLGFIGIAMARSFQQLMLVMAGFIAGGYIISSLLRLFEFNIPVSSQVLFVLCGLIGAGLVTSLFDWAVIFLSSVSGAALVTENLTISRQHGIYLFGALLVFGIAFQAGWLRLGRRPTIRR